ncbi:hypothetical protein C7H52_06440 [Aurantibacter aestuarii]|uniref:Uncharacterized protein n=1 Tax=Aurantibacter aestuarii TaxID=1266046 RepID=A0A2T1NEN8_9FLAO|nr:hypothetical protein C7H52_06440 [Aurantibacter aestuarii]
MKLSTNIDGKWINASEMRPFRDLDIITFENDKINYSVLESTENELNLKEKKVENRSENLSDLKFEFINPSRIRFYRKGKKHTVINETESKTEDKIFEHDYVKLIPTESKISESRIQLLKYNFEWNNEKGVIEFNKILDKPEILEMLKKSGYAGRKILLEKIDDTLLISTYHNNHKGLVLPIKEIDEVKAVLYGFPMEPFETIAERID